MFSSGSSGFYKSPVSKALLLIYGSSSLAHLLLRREVQELFTYHIGTILQQSQFWRVVTSHLVICEFHVLVLVLLLLYNFRILERRFGSHKYASHIFATSILGSSLNLATLGTLHWFEYATPTVHSAIIGTLGSLFVPLFFDIPNISVQSAANNVPFINVLTGKFLFYILGLQLVVSSACAPYQLFTGLLAGVLYRYDFLRIKTYLVIPKFLADLGSRFLGPLFESNPPRTDPYPQGATIDLQRQIRTDYQEQRWMLLQARQNRQARNGQRQQFAPLNFFQRRQAFRRPLPPTPFQFAPRMNGNFANGGDLNHGLPSTSSAPPSPVVISEERVQQLVDMGFENTAVRSALQATNNDVSQATNILLRE